MSTNWVGKRVSAEDAHETRSTKTTSQQSAKEAIRQRDRKQQTKPLAQLVRKGGRCWNCELACPPSSSLLRVMLASPSIPPLLTAVVLSYKIHVRSYFSCARLTPIYPPSCMFRPRARRPRFATEDTDIWTANKYTSTSNAEGFNARIPTLKTKTGEVETEAVSNEDKSKVLAKAFFPSKRANSGSNPTTEEETPDPAVEMDPLTKDQVTKHLAKLKPYKAPGPDGIPNIVLTKCADMIADRLFYIYDTMIIQEIFYEPWKEFTTVVLRKPGNPKYNVPKAYRPIALINTQVKVLTAILAEQMMYYAETHNLLPDNHFGGRKGRNATDAVHLLVHTIKSAWRKGKVISVLFLDIEGAFPNADNEQLIKNLTKRKLPRTLITFTANMLKNRRTILKFDGYISESITLKRCQGRQLRGKGEVDQEGERKREDARRNESKRY